MRPTLQNIADYAGVSRGTVDRVLHNRPKVSAENRKRVEAALKKFNYMPNPAARSLVLSGKKLNIGVVFPPWSPYYRSEIMRGVREAVTGLRDYGINAVTRRCMSHDPDEVAAVIDSVVRTGIRGLSIYAEDLPPIRKKLQALTQGGMPVVTFNSDIPGCGRMCYVSQDETKSGRMAGDMMAKLLGAKGRILVVCGDFAFPSQKNRVDGFMARLEELGVSRERVTLATTDGWYHPTARAVYQPLLHNADYAGLYMAYESQAGAVAAVRKAGRDRTIRFICHDVHQDTATFLREGTVDFAVDQNIYRQGAMPVTLLADYILAGKKPDSEVAFAPVSIVGPENIPELGE